jgi:hypothetical protein
VTVGRAAGLGFHQSASSRAYQHDVH